MEDGVDYSGLGVSVKIFHARRVVCDFSRDLQHNGIVLAIATTRLIELRVSSLAKRVASHSNREHPETVPAQIVVGGWL